MKLSQCTNKKFIHCDLTNNMDASSSDTASNISGQQFCELCDPKCKYFDCICDSSWKNFDESLKSIKSYSSEILLESLRISTITLCFQLNTNVDIDKLSSKYVSENSGKFYNSLIFNWHTKYQYKKVVSVKIFPNGKVQIAGLSNIKSCAYIMRKVYNKCKEFCEYPDLAKILNVKIAMINSDFKIIDSINS